MITTMTGAATPNLWGAAPVIHFKCRSAIRIRR